MRPCQIATRRRQSSKALPIARKRTGRCTAHSLEPSRLKALTKTPYHLLTTFSPLTSLGVCAYFLAFARTYQHGQFTIAICAACVYKRLRAYAPFASRTEQLTSNSQTSASRFATEPKRSRTSGSAPPPPFNCSLLTSLYKEPYELSPQGVTFLGSFLTTFLSLSLFFLV